MSVCPFSELFIDYRRCTVVPGRARLSRGANSHVSESRKTRKVTAGIEDEEIRAVYVSRPIHLH